MPCAVLPRGGRTPLAFGTSPPNSFVPACAPAHVPPFNDVIDNNPCGKPRLMSIGGTDVSAQNLCQSHYAQKYGLGDFAGDYSKIVLSDSPRGFWRFSDPAVMTDSSGNGLTGTYVGGSTVGGPGVDAGGSAASFSPAQNAFVPAAAPLNLGDTLTIEVWVGCDTAPGSTANILSKGAGAYQLRLGYATFAFLQFLCNGSGVLASCATPFPADGKFHHVVATKSGATSKLYLDGVDVTTTGTNFTLVDTATRLDFAGSGGFGVFTGRLDEVALYATALSLARIQAHYTQRMTLVSE